MKHWYESKLIWIGFSAVALAVFEAYANGTVGKELVLAGIGALVVYLRWITTQGIEK